MRGEVKPVEEEVIGIPTLFRAVKRKERTPF